MAQRRYDPEIEPAVSQLPAGMDLSGPAEVDAARAALAAMVPAAPERDDVSVEDRGADGPPGAPDVPVRIYRPKRPAGGLLPGVLEIHGGGFVLGDLEMMHGWCQVAAAELGCVVVSVEYRLAPEHPFPAGVEDCYAALAWLAAHAAELGVDPERIAVAGQSAGGGLAAATALLARDRGGPGLCFQLLEIPELDDRLETPSMRAFTDTPMWNRSAAASSWRHYLGPEHRGDVSPYAAPSRAKDLSGLPPAYLSTMEYDPLRDEGLIYAMRLLEAGVPVELHNFPGTFHGTSLIAGAAISRRIAREAMEALQRALAA